MCENMINLRAMGFGDFQVNLNVLQRSKNSIEQALQMLCGEENVGASVFN